MSMQFESEVTVNAPPERVMAAMADLEAWPDWMQGLVRAEKLTPEPFGVGTRWREVRKMFGHEAEEIFEVTEYQPPHRLGLFVDGSQGTSGKGEYRFVYMLEPVGEGATRMVLSGDIEMPGMVARLFGFLLKGMFRKGCERDLNALKAHLERA